MPYGIKCAPEVFNDRFREIFNMDQVAVYIDDTIVWGETPEEQNGILEEVFNVAQKFNVKFNLKKC